MLRGILRYRYLIMSRYPGRYVTAELPEVLSRLRTALSPILASQTGPWRSLRTRKQRRGGSGGVGYMVLSRHDSFLLVTAIAVHTVDVATSPRMKLYPGSQAVLSLVSIFSVPVIS